MVKKLETEKLSERQVRTRERLRNWRAAHREEHRASVRQWRKDNPEKYRALQKRQSAKRKELRVPLIQRRVARAARTAANAEAVKERIRIRARSYYLAKRERFLERGKAWRAANKDRNRELIRAWKKANPEKKRHKNRASRLRKFEFLMKAQRGKCAYCRDRIVGPDDCHIDHIIPLSRGGPNRRANLQLTCPPCNLRKRDRDPTEFAQSTGMLL